MKTKQMSRPILVLCMVAAWCCAFSSCQDDEDVQETFIVKDIDYVFEEGDGVTESEVRLQRREYTNESEGGVLKVSYNILKDNAVYDKITFTSDDPEAFSFRAATDSVLVNDCFVSNGEVHVLTSRTVPYGNETVYMEREGYVYEIDVMPRTLFRIDATMTMKYIRATYYLELESKLTGERKTIKGKLMKEEAGSVKVSCYTETI